MDQPRSGSYGQNLARLRERDLITRGGDIALTDEGHALAITGDRPPTLKDLHVRWMNKLNRTQGLMLRKVIECHPDGIHRSALASGTNQSPNSGSFGQNLARLRKLQLVSASGPMIVGTRLLFPEGLR